MQKSPIFATTAPDVNDFTAWSLVQNHVKVKIVELLRMDLTLTTACLRFQAEILDMPPVPDISALIHIQTWRAI
jgi:hypothetical protein